MPLSVREPREDFSINAFGTFNVLECLRDRSPGAAFVYTSTNKVYGENVDGIALAEEPTRYRYAGQAGVPENMPVDRTGHTPYGASKYAGGYLHSGVRAYFRDEDGMLQDVLHLRDPAVRLRRPGMGGLVRDCCSHRATDHHIW